MTAISMQIRWHEGLSIFSSEDFLKSVGDEYGWIGGVDQSGQTLCFLPFTIVREFGIRMVRFRVETVPLVDDFSIGQERAFLCSVMEHLRRRGADIIIPATTNCVFRTYPEGADAAPYGSYLVDLGQGEDVLWRRIDRITRQNINTAEKAGVSVRADTAGLDESYALIRDTFRRSGLPFMTRDMLARYVRGLGSNGLVLVAEYQGQLQSCVVYAFSRHCAYAVYGGNRADQYPGSNKLLHWEAIRRFQRQGVATYDFVGARINPEAGSKAAAINSFKRRLGGDLRQGFIWKYVLRRVRGSAYSAGVKLLRGGDIVDHERHKLTGPTESALEAE